jgi:cyanate permease
VQTQGWRVALVWLAAILALGTIPLHALVLRRRPADLGLLPDGDRVEPAGDTATSAAPPAERSVTTRAALRGVTFWLLTVAFFLSQLGVGAVFVHLVPYLIDRGYSAAFAAGATGLIGVMALPGRLVLTPLGDRVPRSIVAAGIFGLQTVALIVLLLVPATAGVAAFVVLFGAGFGAVTPARAALVAEYYGPAHYGSITGMLALFLTGARAAAPVGAGLIYDLAGGYAIVLWGLVAFSAISVVAVLLAERSAARATLLNPAAAGDG